MKSFSRLALLGLVVAAPVAAQNPAPAPAPAAAPTPAVDRTREIPPKLDYDSVAFARQLTMWFYAGEADSLFAHSAPEMQAQMTKEAWGQAMMQFTGRVGSEASLVEERWVKRNGKRQYWRVLNATDFTEQPVMLRFALIPGKLMVGVGMNPASQAPPVDPN
ncbi:MAG TPA: hypothetical protein VL295_05660 [Gemmatimonadales bacterium]|nr:hypothetical protein [Gemmatimonadales bacterium]